MRLIIVRNEGESTKERMISESYLHGSPVLRDISGESFDPENQVCSFGNKHEPIINLTPGHGNGV